MMRAGESLLVIASLRRKSTSQRLVVLSAPAFFV